MALFDPVSITREIEATPFAHARNVVIAYPHFEDWKKPYKPQPLRMPDARGIYRNVDAFESRYQDMKRDHENNVLKQLRRIQGCRRADCQSMIITIVLSTQHRFSTRKRWRAWCSLTCESRSRRCLTHWRTWMHLSIR
jgi:hypothetical protein